MRRGYESALRTNVWPVNSDMSLRIFCCLLTFVDIGMLTCSFMVNNADVAFPL